MKPVLFRCPTTAEQVQHLIPANPRPSNAGEYVPVQCPACSGVHFINRDGKLAGEK